MTPSQTQATNQALTPYTTGLVYALATSRAVFSLKPLGCELLR